MTDTKKALEQRKAMRRKRPTFTRQDQPNLKRLKDTWRKPRGLQSKTRLCKKGHGKRVRVGYGTPKAAHGVHRNGLVPVRVHTLAELKKIDASKECVFIARSVGKRKRVELAKLAEQNKIVLLNIKDPAAFVKQVEQDLKKKKDKKKSKTLEQKVKPKPKKEAKKDVKEEPKTKEEQKKELDKLLTKRDTK